MLNGLIGEIITNHAREELVNRIAMCGATYQSIDETIEHVKRLKPI